MMEKDSEEIRADRATRGERLRAARGARRLTQAALARDVECDAMTISRVERGAVGLGRRIRRSIEARLALSEGTLALPDEVEDAPPPLALVPVPRDQSDRYGPAIADAAKGARRRRVSAKAIRIVSTGVMSEGSGQEIDSAHMTNMMVAVDEVLKRGGHDEPDEENRAASVPKMGSKRKRQP